MDVPMSWMKEYAPVTADIKDFIEDITLSGSKVEGYTTVAGEIKNVVTGYIKEIVKHPDADKLVICTIDAGQGRNLTIVTGAPNVRVGDYVPVALNNSDYRGRQGNPHRRAARSCFRRDALLCGGAGLRQT